MYIIHNLNRYIRGYLQWESFVDFFFYFIYQKILCMRLLIVMYIVVTH